MKRAARVLSEVKRRHEQQRSAVIVVMHCLSWHGLDHALVRWMGQCLWQHHTQQPVAPSTQALAVFFRWLDAYVDMWVHSFQRPNDWYCTEPAHVAEMHRSEITKHFHGFCPVVRDIVGPEVLPHVGIGAPTHARPH